jgi:hypothetical protein
MAQRMVIDTSGNVGIGTTSPTATLHVVGTGLFTGLVSGITPVAAANFVTKAYVDGSGGGTGPFLPLAGGTMTGTTGVTMPDSFPLFLGSSGVNDSQIFWDGDNIEVQARKANADIVFRAANSSGVLGEFLAIDGGVQKTRAYKDIHFQDNVKASFGDTTTPDLQIYHDGSNSYIQDTSGTGDLIIDTSTFRLRSANGGETMIRAFEDSAVILSHNNFDRLTTTSTGVTVTNTLDVQSFIYVGGNDSVFAENNLRFKSAGAAFIDHNTVSQSIKFRLSNSSSLDVIPLEITPSYMVSSVDMYFGDNDKIRLGASSDLQIYHDQSHSRIDETGTGGLIIRTGNFYLRNPSDQEMITASSGAAVELYHNNTKKLSTGSAGVGTATTTGGTLIDGWITTTQANAINNTTIATTAYVNNKIALIPAGLVFQGTWNAATNTPTLTSGTGTTGNFYIGS